MAALRQQIEHLDNTLSDPTKPYKAKVDFLVTSWMSFKMSNLRGAGPVKDENSLRVLYRATVKFVLHGEWKNISDFMKTSLQRELSDCARNLGKYNEDLASLCHTLEGLVQNPWGNNSLINIIEGKPCGDSEVREFLQAEKDILKVRLQTLCSDKQCTPLALRLAEAIWKHHIVADKLLLNGCPEEDLLFMLDLYIVLLYKSDQRKLINKAKELSLGEGLKFAKRLKGYHTSREGVKIWKRSLQASGLVLQVLVARGMIQQFNTVESVLDDLLSEWVEVQCALEYRDEELTVMIFKIAGNAKSSAHIFTFCRALMKKMGNNGRLKCIELYIKGLAKDMNYLEQLRDEENTMQQNHSLSENQETAVLNLEEHNKNLRSVEARLSAGFLELADLLSSSIDDCRECVLTAFSLDPTPACFERVKAMAERSGKCKTEVIDTGQPTDLNIATVNGENEQLLDATRLGLPQALCDDLAVVLNCPRYRVLNWKLEWDALSKLCLQQMEQGVRHVVKELKYLEIDYNAYKDWPKEEENGVEKGYELDTQTEHNSDDDGFPQDFSSSETTDAGSDCSFSMKSKKAKRQFPLDPRRKKAIMRKSAKRNYISSDDSRGNNTDVSPTKKPKCQRKPKAKSPKSEVKRNGKSSVVELIADNLINSTVPAGIISTPNRNPHLTHKFMENFLNKQVHAPKDREGLSVLRNFRKSKTTISPPSHADSPKLTAKIILKTDPNIESLLRRKSSGCKEPYFYDKKNKQLVSMVPGLDSHDMMVPELPQPTVQVVQVSGGVPPQDGTNVKREENTNASDQMNGKTSRSQSQSTDTANPSTSQSAGQASVQLSANLVTPKLVENYYASNRIVETNAGVRTAVPEESTSSQYPQVSSTADVQTQVSVSAVPQAIASGMEHVSVPSLPGGQPLANPRSAQRKAADTSQGWVANASPILPAAANRNNVPKLTGDKKQSSTQTSQSSSTSSALPQFEQAFGLTYARGGPDARLATVQVPMANRTGGSALKQALQGGSRLDNASPLLLQAVTGNKDKTAKVDSSASPVVLGNTPQPVIIPQQTGFGPQTVATKPVGSALIGSPEILVPAPNIPVPGAILNLPLSSVPLATVPVTTTAVPLGAAEQTINVVKRTKNLTRSGTSGQQEQPLPSPQMTSFNQAAVQTNDPEPSSESNQLLQAAVVSNLGKRTRPKPISTPKFVKPGQLPDSFGNTMIINQNISTATRTDTIQGAAAAAEAAVRAAAAAATPSNVSRPLRPTTSPVSSTGTGSSASLEAQLLEFESVLKKVHTTHNNHRQSFEGEEISSTSTSNATATSPQSVSQSPVERSPVSASPVQQTTAQVGVQTQVSVGQVINFNQSSHKLTVSSSFTQTPATPSPAPSVTSQSSSSPCTTPGSSIPSTPAKSKSKPKVKTSGSTGTNIPTTPPASTLKSTCISKPQKSTEDEQTTQRILSILRQYDEQLRSSPDINNKPAPRRRNQAQSGSSPGSKRKKNKNKSSSASEMSPSTDDTHTMGSEDSSVASHFAEAPDAPQSPPSSSEAASLTGDPPVASPAVSTAASLTAASTGLLAPVSPNGSRTPPSFQGLTSTSLLTAISRTGTSSSASTAPSPMTPSSVTTLSPTTPPIVTAQLQQQIQAKIQISSHKMQQTLQKSIQQLQSVVVSQSPTKVVLPIHNQGQQTQLQIQPTMHQEEPQNLSTTAEPPPSPLLSTQLQVSPSQLQSVQMQSVHLQQTQTQTSPRVAEAGDSLTVPTSETKTFQNVMYMVPVSSSSPVVVSTGAQMLQVHSVANAGNSLLNFSNMPVVVRQCAKTPADPTREAVLVRSGPSQPFILHTLIGGTTSTVVSPVRLSSSITTTASTAVVSTSTAQLVPTITPLPVKNTANLSTATVPSSPSLVTTTPINAVSQIESTDGSTMETAASSSTMESTTVPIENNAVVLSRPIVCSPVKRRSSASAGTSVITSASANQTPGLTPSPSTSLATSPVATSVISPISNPVLASPMSSPPRPPTLLGLQYQQLQLQQLKIKQQQEREQHQEQTEQKLRQLNSPQKTPPASRKDPVSPHRTKPTHLQLLLQTPPHPLPASASISIPSLVKAVKEKTRQPPPKCSTEIKCEAAESTSQVESFDDKSPNTPSQTTPSTNTMAEVPLEPKIPETGKKSHRKKIEAKPKTDDPLVSQHMDETISRVAKGYEDDQREEEECAKGDLEPESIPMEVAIAELCGEDISVPADGIKGNHEIKTGEITLLPADPSDNSDLDSSWSERPQFSVIKESPKHSSVKLEEKPDTSSVMIDSPVVSNSPGILGDPALMDSPSDVITMDVASGLVKDSSVIVRDVSVVKAAPKRKNNSFPCSFSEQSQSLTGSEDFNMEKPSTSDLFPEAELPDSNLSPSFSGLDIAESHGKHNGSEPSPLDETAPDSPTIDSLKEEPCSPGSATMIVYRERNASTYERKGRSARASRQDPFKMDVKDQSENQDDLDDAEMSEYQDWSTSNLRSGSVSSESDYSVLRPSSTTADSQLPEAQQPEDHPSNGTRQQNSKPNTRAVQGKKSAVKRKEAPVESTAKKQEVDKRKRISRGSASGEVEDNKSGTPGKKSVMNRTEIFPRDTQNVTRRVSLRVHKPVTKFDEPQSKGGKQTKTVEEPQTKGKQCKPVKGVAHKKK